MQSYRTSKFFRTLAIGPSLGEPSPPPGAAAVSKTGRPTMLFSKTTRDMKTTTEYERRENFFNELEVIFADVVLNSLGSHSHSVKCIRLAPRAMDFTDIRFLKDNETHQKLKVRVCRAFRQTFSGVSNQEGNLIIILVDQMEDAVQANVRDSDHNLVRPKFNVGLVYEITRFFTVPAKDKYKIVPHPLELTFNNKTVFKELPGVHASIPTHRFYIQEYDQLASRCGNNNILTDILGKMIKINPLREITIKGDRKTSMCEIHLHDLRKKTLQVTLWGDTAKNFDQEFFEILPVPVIVAITSLTVKQYQEKFVFNGTNSTLIIVQPAISELDAYKKTFADSKEPLIILQSGKKLLVPSHQFENLETVTVETLNTLNPSHCLGQLFLCTASIARFDTQKTWWYEACPTCNRQVRTLSNTDQLGCEFHPTETPVPWYKVSFVIEDSTTEINVLLIGKAGEKLFRTTCKELVLQKGYDDKKNFPPDILQTEKQTRTFKLKFGKKRNFQPKNDILIQDVLDEPTQVSQPTNTSPTTPIPHVKQPQARGKQQVRKALYIEESSKKNKSTTTGDELQIPNTEQTSDTNLENTETAPLRSFMQKSSPNKVQKK